MPIEERAKKIDIKDNILPSTKILGIVWMAEEVYSHSCPTMFMMILIIQRGTF